MPFNKNPLIINKRDADIKENELLQAYYEHCLKEIYKDFIQNVLESFTHDDLEFYRKFGITTLEALLSSKPEMEETILTIIVNKLGD